MVFRFGEYVVDPDRLEITRGQDPVLVQPQVFALLLLLIESHDRVVSKDEIIEKVWGGRIISDGTLNARINAARNALGDNGEAQAIIRTFPRRGFRFVAELEGSDRAEQTPAQFQQKSVSANGIESDGKPAIAVLPFANLSSNPDEEFLADGITEDLVTALSKLRGFFVTDRSTTFAYKGSPQEARTIAEEIGVRYVLQGSVRSSSNRVRVTAQLMEAQTGLQIWSERYDRELIDIFAIQDEITESLVGCLSPELYAAEHARLRRRTPQSLDAWECFVNALHQYGQQSRESSAMALELLERAIEIDPDYAQALGLYAITLAWRIVQRWEPRDRIEQARRAADRAILADTNEPWAAMGRGMVSMVARDSNAAIMNFGHAVDLSPNFAYAHAMLGAANAYGGNPDLAIIHIDTAVRLSPRDTFIDKFHLYYALAHFQAGRYLQAAQAANRAIQLKPRHANSHMIAAAAYGLADEKEKAEDALSAFKNLVPNTNASNVERAVIYADPKDRARMAEGLRKAGLEG